MHIGPIPVEAGAALAPMAGATDKVMRAICVRYGAVFTVSEMVSAKAISMGDKKSRLLLRGKTEGAPYGVQLFGHEPDVMADAVRRIESEAFDFLDLNMGCPAHKIVGGGAGSALLKDPALAGRLAQRAVQASTRPVSAKLRIGWDGGTLTGVEVAKRCEAAGVQMLCVHARTREAMYTPGVDAAAVAAIKAAVKIPVVFNGDVDSAQAALAAIAATGCDGVMIGRAAVGNPFLFREVAAVLRGEAIPAPPTLRERFAVLDEQVRALCDEMGEALGMCKARGIAGAYMKGIAGAAALRNEAHRLVRYADLQRLLERAYEMNA